ncbi:Protein phosphatase 1G [Armadillidium vulgare]|nr:Protein phosphatase 1G [Armadillidium vulgare]
MFDHCLSPDAHGDGTGCDNMTCIIVKFSNSVSASEKVKRPYEENELEKNDSSPQDKRRKLDTDIAE